MTKMDGFTKEQLTQLAIEIKAKIAEMNRKDEILTRERRIKDANDKIGALISEAEAKISEAEKIANEAGVTFSFSVAYGMGGTYFPPKIKEDDEEWEPSDTGWVSSSAQC